jgi:TRAP-type C4-dicarboxylate transport system substrate-binding protein
VDRSLCAGSLYNFQNTLEGIEQGLGDIGWVGTLWEPVKMPLHNVAHYATFAATNPMDLMEIQEELEANFPAFGKEWTRHNIKFLGAQVFDSLQLMTKKPIRRFEDVRGLKLLAAGGSAALTSNTGAIPVGGGLPVIYNMLKTGVVDGAIMITTGMVPFKLHEVAPYITKSNFGAFISGALAMNMDTWNGLPKDVQEVFLGLGKEYARTQTKMVMDLEKASLTKLLSEGGAKISSPSPAERKRWAMTINDVAGDWARNLEKKGIPAKALLARFMAEVRKRGGKPLRDWK